MIKKLILLLFICANFISSQVLLNEDEIARIGNKSISSDEFLERIELTPQFRKNIKALTPSLKLEFLYTIIAEKLMASAAENAGYDTTKAIRTAVSSIEKMYVRDALFREEIRNKIIISETELIQAKIKNARIYNVGYLFSKDSSEISGLYKALQNGEKFDLLLKNREEYKEQINGIDVYYGNLVENIEDELFKLSDNQYTVPSKAEDGWYIFYVYKLSERKFNSAEEIENANKEVEKILTNRIGEKIQNEFYENFFGDKKIDVNRELFALIANELSDIFKYKSGLKNKDDNTLLHLDAYDLIALKKKIGDAKLNTDFIQFVTEPVKLNEFLDELAFDGFPIEEFSPQNVISNLNTRVRIFIERELLAREGYKRNLQNDPEVIRYVSMWKDYYLSQSFLSSKVENQIVSDDEVKKYYDNMYRSDKYQEMVNIIEVLVEDADTANYVYKLASGGTDIKELARKYSKRIWTKNTSGEFGLFPVNLFGALGKTAGTMKLNEISKPIKTEDGYSVIKLIDRKKERTDPPSKSFEQVKNSLKREIAFQKEYDQLVDTTAAMASSSMIKINQYLLNSIQVSNINSFAIRVMGFGGKITAVPISKPFTDWVDKWLHKTNILP